MCKEIKEDDDSFFFLTEEPQTGNAVGARSLGKDMERSRARGSSSAIVVFCV